MIWEQLTPALALAATGAFVLAWRFPWAGIGFVVSGTVPYYALLHTLSIGTSASLTGGVFAGSGVGALIRLGTRRRIALAGMAPPIALFGAFVLIWYLRWIQEPPHPGFAEESQFATRAPLFMIAYAILPFLGGAMVRDERDLRNLLAALASWGGALLTITLLYWVTGMPSLGPEWSSKWEPIANLNGITHALEISLGCIAVIGAEWTGRRRSVRWIRWSAVAVAAALVLRIGQRGPFVAFLVGLITLLFATRQKLTKRVAGTVVAAAIVAGIAYYVGENYTSRSFAASSYTRDANEARLDLISMGIERFSERPLLGWGGSLVGESVGNERWKYLHIAILDPFVETGLIGALPFCILLGFVLREFAQLYSTRQRAGPLTGVVLALFSAAFVESLFSGHVSGARHLWIMAGVILSGRRWSRALNGTKPSIAHGATSFGSMGAYAEAIDLAKTPERRHE